MAKKGTKKRTAAKRSVSKKPIPVKPAAAEKALKIVRELKHRAASRLVIGFDGTAMTRELGELIDAGIAGVILFRRNCESPEQVAALNKAIFERARRPFFVSVDQEGGPVQRLRAPFTEFPPHGVLGAIGDTDLTKRVAGVVAKELKTLGFNVDYAPVADVNTNPKNPVIGIRSFSADAETVSDHVRAWIKGMQGAGVMACAKHFPGHGDTSLDSHLALPKLTHDRKRIEKVELVPFRAAVAARVGSIMTAHVVFQALDKGVPATLSRKVLTGLLRDSLGFGGLIISDDLEMKAVADTVGVPQAAVQSLDAGADLLLVCRTRGLVLDTLEALTDALADARLDSKAQAVSERRIAKSLASFGKPLRVDPAKVMKVVGSKPHTRLAAEVAKRAKEAGVAWAPPTPAASSPVAAT